MVGIYCSEEAKRDKRVVENIVSYVICSHNQGGFVSCPGNAPNVITVGATDNNGTTKASYSNYNTKMGMNKPTIVANGAPHVPYINDPFHTDFGTSYATPMVAGALATLLSKAPTLKLYPEKQIALLMANANLQKMSGYFLDQTGMSDYFGAGMLDVDSTMANYGRVYAGQVSQKPETSVIVEQNVYVSSADIGKTLRSSFFVYNYDYINRSSETAEPYIPHYDLVTYFNGSPIDMSMSTLDHTSNCLTGFAKINQAGTYTIKIFRGNEDLAAASEKYAYAYSIQSGTIIV